MVDEQHQWYTNKEIFERVIQLSQEFVELRGELRETKIAIRQFNDIRKQIELIEKKVAVLEEQIQTIVHQEKGKDSVWKGVRDWGGWIFGLITLLVLVYNQLFSL